MVFSGILFETKKKKNYGDLFLFFLYLSYKCICYSFKRGFLIFCDKLMKASYLILIFFLISPLLFSKHPFDFLILSFFD